MISDLKILKICILGILFSFSMSAEITACSCNNQPLSILDIIDKDIFFRGEVIEKKIVDEDSETGKFEYIFKINELIKGEYQNQEIIIYSDRSQASCGVNYPIGYEFFIFTNQYENKYQTGSCYHNQTVKNDKSFIHKLVEDYKNESRTEWFNSLKKNIAEGRILNGKPDGYWIIKTPNEEKIEEGNYTQGRKNGEWRIFRHRKYYSKAYTFKLFAIYENGVMIKSKKIEE